MITGLHHYALAVPGLDVADDFLRGFGLETAAEDGGLVARCPGRDQAQVRMVEAPAEEAAPHGVHRHRPGPVARTPGARRGARDRAARGWHRRGRVVP